MCSTYNVEVGWVGGARVSQDPWRAASLHVNDGGAQAVDVCLGVMSSTQNHFWTHIHLKKKKDDITFIRFNTTAEDNSEKRYDAIFSFIGFQFKF